MSELVVEAAPGRRAGICRACTRSHRGSKTEDEVSEMGIRPACTE